MTARSRRRRHRSRRNPCPCRPWRGRRWRPRRRQTTRPRETNRAPRYGTGSWAPIVCHEEIDAAIVVVVAEDDAEALAVGSVDSRRWRHVVKVPSPLFGTDVRRRCCRRPAGSRRARGCRRRSCCCLPDRRSSSRTGRGGHRCRCLRTAARAQGRAADAGGPGHVGERTVAVVSIKRVRPEIRQVQVFMAVVVVVRRACSHSIPGVLNLRCHRDIVERAVAAIVKQPRSPWAATLGSTTDPP